MKKTLLATLIGAVCALAIGAASAADAPAAKPAAKVAPMPTVDAAYAQKLDQVIAGDWRSDKNKARDKYRHPKETLQFFGAKPGMNLIELTPGGGWYAEILAPLQKLSGGGYTAAIVTPKKKA